MHAPSRGTVVVTGASSGIGRAVTLELDRLGFRVLAGHRSAADGDALRAAGSPRVVPVRVDVTDAAEVAALAAEVDASCGGDGLAALVNNAGIAVAAPVEFLPLDELRRQLEVNVVGQVAVTQALLPALRRARGRIVNIGSVSGRFAAPFLSPYAASKHALEAITDALRVELRPWGMQVSIVEPGAIATAIWERSLAAARAMIADFPPEAVELYGGPMAGMEDRVRQLRGIPAGAVARAVVHAITARRARARYVVGRDARLRLLVGRLPTRLRDALVARAVGSGS
jgi:NAD(P)-dependent dehydrogenase (short-subunit alcohol dehydrogenase family)